MKTTESRPTDELEKQLLSQFGAKSCYTVPEGYFDNLTERVMSNIPKSKRRQTPWRWVAAAILAGCVATGGLLLESHHNSQTADLENIQYIEDALDYSMIDNMSIASYLTEVE